MPDDQPPPEVVIPPPESPQPGAERTKKRTKKRSKSGRRPRQWERVKSWGKITVAILAGVPSVVVAIGILGSLLVLIFHRHSLDLDAIGVPETLSKAGFTSEVATQHLRDAIYAVQERAETSMTKTGVDISQDLSAITIPQTGLSLQSVAVAVRSLVPGWRHEVSGEFVQLENGLLLRLRHNGKVVFSKTAEKADPGTADTLLGKDDLQGGGAFYVVEETQPYVAASALYGDGTSGDNLTAAGKEADRIIALFPAGDENVLWAINLKKLIAEARDDAAQAEVFFKKLPSLAVARNNLGNIYYGQQKLNEAITEYQAAVRLDPKYSPPHSNLGSLYEAQGKPEMAIAEYQAAIQLDPELASPHVGLGHVYYDQHKPEMAITEYQAAIQLDPKAAVPHVALGLVYQDQHKPEMAIAEYQMAIQLDPKFAGSRVDLGDLYYSQHKLEMAIDEYQKAIELDPKLAPAQYNLGIALRDIAASSSMDTERAKRLEDACRAFEEGSKLALDDSGFPARMHEIDSLMQGHGHCPPT